MSNTLNSPIRKTIPGREEERTMKMASGVDKEKIIKAALLSAAASAAVGAWYRKRKAKSRRDKEMDIERSKDSIVVPVSEKAFMQDVPTPSQQAIETGQADSETPVLEVANADTPPSVGSEATPTPEQIKDIKRNVLRGRKFDFFGRGSLKAAESDKDGKEAVKDPVPAPEPDDEQKKKKDEGDGRVILRDQSGRFVSPSDPIGVEQAEKEAGAWSLVTDLLSAASRPFKSVKEVGRAAIGSPVAWSVGALGSLYLATKISDAINERRKERSRRRIEDAQDMYVSILNGDKTEKTAAQNGVTDLTGKAIGTAFFVPMVLTALITRKIQENRRQEKKRMAEVSDSYPDDPVILYRTINDSDMKISPETALMSMSTKVAMILDAERCERKSKESELSEKSAQAKYSPEVVNAAVNDVVNRLLDDKNTGKLLDLVKRYNSPGSGDVNFSDEFQKNFVSPMREVISSNSPGDAIKTYKTLSALKDISNTPEFRAALAKDPRLQNEFVKRFEVDPEWKKYKQEQIDSGISDKITNDWGFERGGFMHKLLSWIMKFFGAGNSQFNQTVRNKISGLATPADLAAVAENKQYASALQSLRNGNPSTPEYREAYNAFVKRYPNAASQLKAPTEQPLSDETKAKLDSSLAMTDTVGRGLQMSLDGQAANPAQPAGSGSNYVTDFKTRPQWTNDPAFNQFHSTEFGMHPPMQSRNETPTVIQQPEPIPAGEMADISPTTPIVQPSVPGRPPVAPRPGFNPNDPRHMSDPQVDKMLDTAAKGLDPDANGYDPQPLNKLNEQVLKKNPGGSIVLTR